MSEYILVIDEGTTSTRAMLFAPDGTHHGTAQRELTQYYPHPGWVEHDAEEIWQSSLACTREMVTRAGGAGQIAALGITNQRETIVFWDKRSGKPLGPALVWQDRRTGAICNDLRNQGAEPLVQNRTGLLLDPYFSASKISWALSQHPEWLELGQHLACGTIESYLVARLTGGLHISDATNASRTAVMDIEKGNWDVELCELFAFPPRILPEIVDNAAQFGSTHADLFGRPIPITGLVGDQQGALIGQACFNPGQTKATFGTGAFILTNVGREIPRSANRLLSTVAWQLAGERYFALEGSIFVAGSLIKWLRDGLGLISSSEETEALAASVADSGGVVFVPALSGLGAPHWRPEAKGALSGLNFTTGKAHVVRAALESVSYQTHDLKSAFARDGHDWQSVAIDGGMAENNWLCQNLSDMLDLPVTRPTFTESTALGAAMLAAVGAGFYPNLDAAAAMGGSTKTFSPNLNGKRRMALLDQWTRALAPLIATS